MSYRRFFFQHPEGANPPLKALKLGTNLVLNESIHHHWCRVLRASIGDCGILFDGYGHETLVELSSISKKSAGVTILKHYPINRTLDIHVTVAMVMSRGDRTDYAVQKSSELGVTAIQMLSSHHSEVNLKPAQLDKKLNHWQQVAVSACEQCGLNFLPLIHSPLKVEAWLEGETGFFSDDFKKIAINNPYYAITDSLNVLSNISHEQNSISHGIVEPLNHGIVEPLKLILSVPKVTDINPVEVHHHICQYIKTARKLLRRPKVTILVGPEGGFSKAEHSLASKAGFIAWQLGDRVLRAETAPVVALSTLNALSQLC